MSSTKLPPRLVQDINYEEWSEEQLEGALDKLKDIHLELRNLRSTIPRMVQPLVSEPTQPRVEEVRSFKEAVSSDDFRKVIDHAASSRRKNSKNIKPWKPRDDPGWASAMQP